MTKRKKAFILLLSLAAAFTLTFTGCGAAKGGNSNSSASLSSAVSSAANSGTQSSSAAEPAAASSSEAQSSSAASSAKASSSAASSKDSAASSKEEAPKTADTDVTPVTMYTTAGVNFREGPGTSYGVIKKLNSGTEVTKNGENGSWARVEVDKQKGYVSSNYLSEKKPDKTDYSTGQPVSGTTFVKKAPGECLIAIDAGHQGHANSEKEPDGPGSSVMKAKVAAGTSGAASGLAEYQLTLQVSLKLQKELESRGYKVLMIRTSHDVNISNAERAKIANDAGADAFLRIHANGSDDPSIHGCVTACQTSSNPYNANLYSACRTLSEDVLDCFCAATGAKKKYVWEVDNMSGINWCTVPVTIVELGFMTNPDEDLRMATEDYQYAMAKGIADGVDAFFGN
ncbi:MAG: N-acetylmuramoyl-L-alanine amidase [Lachnospiraceae bacterium]|nr:N-acetylmuramoyl-L-alanine amidase [Lachnospiraceae bacterium]